MDHNIIADLRASAEHSRICGWELHARMDDRAADQMEKLVAALARIEREAADFDIIKIARNALGLDGPVSRPDQTKEI